MDLHPEPGDEPDHYLRGCLVEITAPPIKAGTTVTWHISAGGQDVGTFHSELSWTAYESTIPTPTSRTVYWRSDYDEQGGLARTYQIEATYIDPDGQQQMATCEIVSRAINDNDVSLKSDYQADVDMLQRLMIQVHYLDITPATLLLTVDSYAAA